nr:hypothetical protein [Marinobacter gelidimuriae]
MGYIYVWHSQGIWEQAEALVYRSGIIDDVWVEPELDLPFIPGRVEKRVRTILQGLDFKWSYPEHPGRLAAIKAPSPLCARRGITPSPCVHGASAY